MFFFSTGRCHLVTLLLSESTRVPFQRAMRRFIEKAWNMRLLPLWGPPPTLSDKRFMEKAWIMSLLLVFIFACDATSTCPLMLPEPVFTDLARRRKESSVARTCTLNGVSSQSVMLCCVVLFVNFWVRYRRLAEKHCFYEEVQINL